uniref:Uncharacterized protein n=1 Tax=Setaria italica TaxID=4555 RepID=K4A4G9_SETIT
MCRIKEEMVGESASPCSSPSTSSDQQTVWTSPPKRPAGRTKFRETGTPCSAASGAAATPGGGCARYVCRGGAAAGSGSAPSTPPSRPRARTTPPCSPPPARAQRMLMEPPSAVTAFCDDSVAEVPLWNY